MKYFAHAIFLFYSNNTGDHYLGRLLAGLDPHQTTFGDLPPHFKVGMENEDIHDFMYLLYGPIIRQYEEKLKVTSCLLLFAASLVYHSGTFEDIMLQKPNHFFSRLPMFSDQPLLRRVRQLVTKDPTPNLHEATGIPPHI